MEDHANGILKTNQQSQTININGEIRTQTISNKFVECSNCHRVIANFNPTDPLPAIIDCIHTQLAADIKYCPTCGSKLTYTATIIDANLSDSNTNV